MENGEVGNVLRRLSLDRGPAESIRSDQNIDKSSKVRAPPRTTGIRSADDTYVIKAEAREEKKSTLHRSNGNGMQRTKARQLNPAIKAAHFRGWHWQDKTLSKPIRLIDFRCILPNSAKICSAGASSRSVRRERRDEFPRLICPTVPLNIIRPSRIVIDSAVVMNLQPRPARIFPARRI